MTARGGWDKRTAAGICALVRALAEVRRALSKGDE